VDPAIQLGDGGWGIIAEFQAYQKLLARTYLYAEGFYLANPRNENGVPNLVSSLPNSVPDQYMARAGVSYTIWPQIGLALSLGGRIDGIPVDDLIGGSSGFRRAGYAVYIEPGISLNIGAKDFLSVSPAFAVARNELTAVGGLAAWTLFFTWTHRF
jgi:hypothetical protein